MRRRWVVAAVVAAAVLTAAIVVPLEVVGNSPSRAAALASWSTKANAALTPLADRVTDMVQEAAQWEAGTLTTADYRPELSRTVAIMIQAEGAVTQLPAYPSEPAVDQMYRASTELYAQAAMVQQTDLSVPPGALRDQIELMAERLHELADRVFDQGRLLTSAGLTPAGVPAGTQVELPLEVPDWVAEGLAAGPPLAPLPPPAAKFPPTRQGPRPTQAVHQWDAAVAAQDVPPQTTLTADLASSAAPLAALAARLQGAVTAVGDAPDPAEAHGRQISDRLRLGLLVAAEAARSAQAALLAPPAASAGLAALARTLLAIAASIPAGPAGPAGL